MRRSALLALCGVALALLLAVPAARAEFTFNGYILHEYGIFISNEANQSKPDPDRTKHRSFPKDHGGLLGLPSIARNVLQLEADYWPTSYIRLKGIFRGVLSGTLLADRYAQVPIYAADRFYNNDKRLQEKKEEWVAEHYYREADIRELYLDIFATKRLSFRLGRQQVAWGSTGNFRLLDVVNPINSTWHFASFEAFEDTRIPLWMAKVLYDVPALNGSIEALWVPGVDFKRENLVTPPLTFVGAWGLPIPPQNQFDSTITITRKNLVLPPGDLSGSRVGARWLGQAGGLSYTLVYYWTHAISPPIPAYVEQSLATNSEGLHDTEVFLEFPRQHVFGFSLEYAFESPASLVLKLEASCEPNRRFPLNSFLGPAQSLDRGHPGSWTILTDRPGWQRADFADVRRTVASYALVLQRPNQWRWLNPTDSVITQFQVFQSFMFDQYSIRDGVFKLGHTGVQERFADGHREFNKRWWIVDIPGYDTTRSDPYSTLLVFAILTNYLQGMISPTIITAYLPQTMKDEQVARHWRFFAAVGEAFKKGSGFTSVSVRFKWDNHWRLEVGFNEIYGFYPYKALGLFRDRDEVYTKVMYQF